MNRPTRMALIVGGSLGGLLLVMAAAGMLVVRTAWFRDLVRNEIIGAAADATGGRVEVGSFTFEWTHMRASVRDFVIHGLEPSGAAPLFRARSVEVGLGFGTAIAHVAGIRYLTVDQPQASVIVFPDGRTNVPSPKLRRTSSKSGLQTVVDLAIGRFNLRDGSLSMGDRRIGFRAAGRELRTVLGYDPLRQAYTGEIDMDPLLLESAGNAPVNATVRLPVTLAGDRITLAGVQLTTAGSKVTADASLTHLADPILSGHIQASVALAEVKRAAGLSVPLDVSRGPAVLQADVSGTFGGGQLQLSSARVTLGQSRIQASGGSEVKFEGRLALAEIGRLFRVSARPQGAIAIGGNATLGSAAEYLVTANVDGRDIAFTQGGRQIRGVEFESAVTVRPNLMEFEGIRVTALGGSLSGSATVRDRQLRLAGDLRDFDGGRLSRTLLGRDLGLGASLSGSIRAQGAAANLSALDVQADIRSTPTRAPAPVSGQVHVSYHGASGAIRFASSQMNLPRTAMAISGTLGEQLNVQLVSRDLGDIQRVAALPVNLRGGNTVVDATITGPLASPQINARLSAAGFTADDRRFDRLTATIALSKSGAAVHDAELTRQGLAARFDLTAGLRDWKPAPNQPLRLDGTIRNGDLRDLLALAGRSTVPVTGILTADIHVTGTMGSPAGSAQFSVVSGTARGEPFDSLTGRAVMSANAIEVPAVTLVAGPSRVDAQATYRHVTNDLRNGTLQLHVASSQVQLAQFQALVKGRPGLRGILSLNGDVNATIQPSRTGAEVQITRVDASLNARGLQMEGRTLGDVTAVANTAGNTVRYRVNSDFAGSNIAVDGESLLTGDHQTTATANIANLPIDRVLAVAGRTDLPLRGTLGGAAQLSGTLASPRVNVQLQIAKGSVERESFDSLRASISYTDQLLQVTQLDLAKDSSRIQLAGSLAHPAGDYESGQLRFDVRASQFRLGRSEALQQAQPGLDGVVQLTAAGAATLRRDGLPLLSMLNGDLSTRGLTLSGAALGNLTATAQTQGREVVFDLQSDLARSTIQGNGRMQISPDYPAAAHLTLSNLTYSGLRNLIGGAALPVEAAAAGDLDISGPLARPDELRGTIQLTRLEAHAQPGTSIRPGQRAVPFDIHNPAPIVLALDRSTVSVRSFRLTGAQTDLNVSGSASLAGTRRVNARIAGSLKLGLLEAFDPNIFSSGGVALDATLTGSLSEPSVNGVLNFDNASFNMVSLPAGLSNANGTVAFTGKEAIIQNLNGEIGGGKLTLAGFVAYGGPLAQFRLQATASRIRVDYPETATTQASARLTLTGTSARSLVSGNVTILDVALHSHSDIGSILSSAAAPAAKPAVRTGLLAGIRFDVRIRTAPETQFRTTLTQNLQADADLTLRGSLDQTGMLGRINVTQGEVVFFGSRYNIDQGSVTFSDPQKVAPVVNVDLETTVQGVQVSISVVGPVDRMKLAYHSDPPMQFSDLVGLLASGKVPTTDPVLAARTPAAPTQSFQQAGASTLLSQAVANPVAGRLQRLFGVTRLSINPEIIGGATNSAQATLTLQQQITPEISFTYSQDVTKANSQVVRVEWAIDRQWSAIAQRDIYGQFDLDFLYKKRFH